MKLVVLVIIVCVKEFAEGTSSAVPKELLSCYKQNYTNTHLKPPFTTQLLVELVRKFEFEEKDALNLRVFTTSLLHGIKFDGVLKTPGVAETEFNIPYRASGKQFYKYKLLVDYMTSGKGQFLPYDSVSLRERCLLHEIISNTVHVWERGNEGRTCPELRSMAYRSEIVKSKTININLSRCPIEGGVVKTNWGPISAGHVIAGIASALEETTVPVNKLVEIIQHDKSVNVTKPLNRTSGHPANRSSITDKETVNNIWLSTVVGDLGEVTVQQVFNTPKLGNAGTWNSTYLPRNFYLKDEPHDMTLAELLGGIDGLIFANKIKDWLSILSRTRLSQLLDMYYSNRGISYDGTYRACERWTKLKALLNSDDLTKQTGNVAKLLQQIGAARYYIVEEALEKYAVQVVKEFEEEAEIASIKYNACEQNIDRVQSLEVLAILDETWRGYKAESLVGVLAGAVDVSFYGSSLGVINGQSGAWITNVTHSLVELYENLYHVPQDSWQVSLRLAKGLETVNMYFQNKSRSDCSSFKIPRSPVILVMGTTASIGQHDIETSKMAINSIKRLYPETRIFYITSSDNSKSYQELAQEHPNDVVIKISEYSEAVIPQIVKELTRVPSRLMDFYCNSSRLRMEDYVTPDVAKFYELHAEYVRRADFTVKFKGNSYGWASVCAYNAKTPADKVCKGLEGNDEVIFDASRYCPEGYGCNVHFSVEVTNAAFKCAELDCRYPDQMRLDILTSWTRKSGSSAIRLSVYLLVLILLQVSLANLRDISLN